jgi:hypothetical protein
VTVETTPVFASAMSSTLRVLCNELPLFAETSFPVPAVKMNIKETG